MIFHTSSVWNSGKPRETGDARETGDVPRFLGGNSGGRREFRGQYTQLGPANNSSLRELVYCPYAVTGGLTCEFESRRRSCSYTFNEKSEKFCRKKGRSYLALARCREQPTCICFRV